ncbi:MAG: nucleoside phosphorylase [Brevefilum sp.]|nr:nucleoside phosphorylase [Brevefilum sp.]MDT8381770.1 nucleoside phosphorylase [Brevefilum sp.]MDW7754887.1 nucleoside phosphorylase [Brevefilum sp.]
MNNLQPHIHLDTSLQIKFALLPGDPARLDRIAVFLDDVKELAYNREFRSLKGLYKGIEILAISTGIGGASAGIAVEELHNIGVSAMIRIGSCGSLQKEVKLGDLVIVNGAVRDDGASKTYIDAVYPAVPDPYLMQACIMSARDLGFPFHVGIARSHDSFYTDREEAIDAYWSERGVLAADMETAALFTIGRLRGVRAASILNNVVSYEEDTADSIAQYVDGENLAMEGEKQEIQTALEAFYRISQ